MSDRIKDLSGTILPEDLETYLSELYWAMDGDALAAAHKLMVATILKKSAIEDSESDIDYLLVTLKALKATIAANDRLGLIKTASNTDIANKTNANALLSNQISSIGDSIRNTSRNDQPIVYLTSNKSFNTNRAAMSWDYMFDDEISTYQVLYMSPNIGDFKFKAVSLQYSIFINNERAKSGFVAFDLRTSGNVSVIIQVGVTNILGSLIVTSDRKNVIFQSNKTSDVCLLSVRATTVH